MSTPTPTLGHRVRRPRVRRGPAASLLSAAALCLCAALAATPAPAQQTLDVVAGSDGSLGGPDVELWEDGVEWRFAPEAHVTVDRPAHVAVFEVVPGVGAVLLWPDGPDADVRVEAGTHSFRLNGLQMAARRRLLFHHTVPAFSSPRIFSPWGRLVAVASDRPLRLKRLSSDRVFSYYTQATAGADRVTAALLSRVLTDPGAGAWDFQVVDFLKVRFPLPGGFASMGLLADTPFFPVGMINVPPVLRTPFTRWPMSSRPVLSLLDRGDRRGYDRGPATLPYDRTGDRDEASPERGDDGGKPEPGDGDGPEPADGPPDRIDPHGQEEDHHAVAPPVAELPREARNTLQRAGDAREELAGRWELVGPQMVRVARELRRLGYDLATDRLETLSAVERRQLRDRLQHRRAVRRYHDRMVRATSGLYMGSAGRSLERSSGGGGGAATTASSGVDRGSPRGGHSRPSRSSRSNPGPMPDADSDGG